MATRLVLAALLAAASSSDAASAVSRRYKLYHAFGVADEFVERGVIILSSPDPDREKPTASIENVEDCLSPERVDATVGAGDMYRIRIIEEGEDGDGGVAMASVPACDVRRANFREEISLTLGHTGSLLSVSYKPIVSPLAPACHALPPLASPAEDGSTPESKFTTLVSYETATPGMTIPLVLPQTRPPPGLSFYPRKDGVGDGKGIPGIDDEKQQSKSFIVRYWYILLPLAIMALTGAPEEEPPQQQQRGGGGAGAAQPGGSGGGAVAAAGVGASAGATAAGGTQRVRRGKRG